MIINRIETKQNFEIFYFMPVSSLNRATTNSAWSCITRNFRLLQRQHQRCHSDACSQKTKKHTISTYLESLDTTRVRALFSALYFSLSDFNLSSSCKTQQSNGYHGHHLGINWSLVRRTTKLGIRQIVTNGNSITDFYIYKYHYHKL